MTTVSEIVANGLANSGPTVRSMVTDLLVKKELERRTSLIVQAVGEIDKLDAQIRKTKPDQKILSATGEVVSEGYSPAKHQELTKAQARRKKIEDAVNLALEQNNFSKIEEVFRGDKSEPAGSAQGGSE